MTEQEAPQLPDDQIDPNAEDATPDEPEGQKVDGVDDPGLIEDPDSEVRP
jgi:hypothetical protein